MTSKHYRVAKRLLETKGKGIPENELFYDREGKDYVRQIKSRANKLLGGDAIIVEDGVWSLRKEYLDIKPIELRDLWITYELSKTRKIVFWTMGAALTVALLFGILVGLIIELEIVYG